MSGEAAGAADIPVVLFAYARPSHTERTILSLAGNAGAAEKDLIVFADGPRSERDANAVRQVRAFLGTVAKRSWFRSVRVRASEENRGLARSVITGVTDVLSSHGAVVVVEDDLELAPDFLSFMDAALAFYRDDDRIWSISGYTPNLPALASYGHDVYLAPRGASWGWGTWSNRWERVDWTVSDYRRFEWAPRRRWRFNRGGPDLAAMLDAQMDGRIDSWAIRWCYSQHLQGSYTVYPAITKVQNIGLDGSGTHGVQDRRAVPALFPAPVTPERLASDGALLREFAGSFRRYNKFPPWSFVRHLAATYLPRPRTARR